MISRQRLSQAAVQTASWFKNSFAESSTYKYADCDEVDIKYDNDDEYDDNVKKKL